MNLAQRRAAASRREWPHKTVLAACGRKMGAIAHREELAPKQPTLLRSNV
jgi:hypothetical protein